MMGKQPPDILDLWRLRDLVKHPWFQPVIQLSALAVFFVIIYRGITSLSDLRFGGSTFATTAVWDLWHPFLIFTVILFGRLWCFACPVGAAGEWVRRKIGKNRAYPDKHRNLWLMIAIFIFIFAEERHLFQFTRNPVTTAYLLIVFFAIALLMGAVFERRSFCRYICPIGLVLGIFSMLSILELRCKSRKTCSEHKTKDCITGNKKGYPCPMFEYPGTMERNNHCIYCTECIKTCPKDNIRISLRKPAADLLNSGRRYSDEAFFIHSIIVIFLFVMGMERIAFRNKIIAFVRWTNPLPESVVFLDLIWRNLWAVIIFTLLAVSAAGTLYLLSRTQNNPQRHFTELSYAFLPLSLSVYMAENTFRFVKGATHMIMETLRLVSIHWQPSFEFQSINHFQITLIITGYLASLALAHHISKGLYKESVKVRKSMLTTFLLLTVYLLFALYTLTLPIV
jgi:hypothetical protein